MRLAQLSLLFVSAISLGSAFDGNAVTGKYRWIASDEMQKVYKAHGMTMPVKTLKLDAHSMFEFSVTDENGVEATIGSYKVENNVVSLTLELGNGAGLPLKLKIEEKGLSATGANFVREVGVAVKPGPAIVNTKATVSGPTASLPSDETELEGTWDVHSNGKEVKALKLIFKGNTFKYVDEGAMEDPFLKIVGGPVGSSGTFSVTDDQIVLVYKVIDGKKLEGDAERKKSLTFIEAHTAFMIDNYRYERASG